MGRASPGPLRLSALWTSEYLLDIIGDICEKARRLKLFLSIGYEKDVLRETIPNLIEGVGN